LSAELPLRTRNRFVSRAALCLIAALCLAGSASAQHNAEWDVSVRPYLWFAAMSGESSLDDILAEIDLPIHLSSDASQIGAMLRLEAQKRAWLLTLDVSGAWVESQASLEIPVGGVSGRIDYDVFAFLLEVGGGWEIDNRPIRVPWGERPARLYADLLVGGRYVRLDQKLGGSRIDSVRAVDNWGEPFVGGRIGFQATPDLGLTVRGDVGGFGIPGASELTWTLVIEGRWRFWRNVALDLGYKLYDIDHSVAGDSFALDARLQGPTVGLDIRY